MDHISTDLLSAFWEALNRPVLRANPLGAARTIDRILGAGWAHRYQVEDLLHDMDARLADGRLWSRIDDMLAAFGIRWEAVCRTPPKYQTTVSIDDGLRVEQLGTFLANLERLGFSVDPLPFARAAAAHIAKGSLITNDQLNMLWFEKTRHKTSSQVLTASARPAGSPDVQQITTATGYRVSYYVASGTPWMIEATAPKYRRPREPIKTDCPECGWTYYRGNPESSRSHRREHKRRMSYLAPEPLPSDRLANVKDGLIEVRSWSPDWMRREVYERAFAFKREFSYDFVQWSQNETDPRTHGFLFVDAAARVVGACAFRWREPGDAEAYWGLQWIWIAPAFRRQGVLASRWPNFRKQFGAFYVEPPLSQAMKDFLLSHCDEGLEDYPPRAGADV